MTDTRDLIWNAITDSAKTRFDYGSFEKEFNEIDANIAENILLKVIEGFANRQTDEIISLELFNQMMMIGSIWKKEDIMAFVEGKDKLLKLEIYTIQLAYSLLQDGGDPLVVLNSVKQLLN